jgi:tRNA (cytidine/uridine-2'-O-)-methyltransferase
MKSPMVQSQGQRLRARALGEPLHIVLLEPEIPQNTGNIARVCAATGSPLHLVGPLGFSIDDKAVRRAGLDYWHLVQVQRHVSMAHFEHALPQTRLLLFSARAGRSYLQAPYRAGDALVFGRESVGLPDDLMDKHQQHVYGVPTMGAVRSLNLANAVGIVLYEALRQLGVMNETYVG